MPSTELLERRPDLPPTFTPELAALPAALPAARVELALRDLVPVADDGTAPSLSAGDPPTRRARIDRAFLTLVAVPVLSAAVALFGVAADRYTSEARFVVRSAGASGASLEPGLGGATLSRAGEDAYVVDDFVRSRDAFAAVEADPRLAAVLDRPESDVFARFPALLSAPTRDQLFARFGAAVRTDVDSATGISTVAVTGFRADDARTLARALIAAAEGMVNRINDRAHADRTAFAGAELARARAAVTEAEARLTAFRTASGTVDPAREYAAALGNVGRLALDVSQRQAALDQQVALTPNAPGIASQREKVRALRVEVDRANLAIAGRDGSLAVKLESYERLTVERDMAVKALASAELGLEASRRDADRQHLYLQTVSEPNLPDVPGGPRRALLLLAVLVGSLVAWTGLRQLKAQAEDHVA